MNFLFQILIGHSSSLYFVLDSVRKKESGLGFTNSGAEKLAFQIGMQSGNAGFFFIINEIAGLCKTQSGEPEF